MRSQECRLATRSFFSLQVSPVNSFIVLLPACTIMSPLRHDAATRQLLQYAVITLLWIASLCCGKTINVTMSGASNETACVSGEYACGNLTMALVGGHNVSDTTVYLEPGSYMLEHCDPTVAFELVRNIAIIGLVADQVNVTCDDGAGLTFLQSTNVTIANISFYGCGYTHESNSWINAAFSKYKVSLFFQQCINITLDRVNVFNSKGIAVQFFATVGYNSINKCTFVNNTGESGITVGGGVYIEFPYCLPGNNTCNMSISTVPDQYTTAGKFNISNSSFSYNEALPPNDQSRVFMVPRKSDHVALGRGGGLSVFFKGHTNHTSVSVSNCHFLHNKAIFGAGAFVDFHDNCHNNSVSFLFCTFVSNNATQQGGGLRLNLEFITSGLNVSYNNMEIAGTQFISNTASRSGGGMFVGATRENASSPTNKLTISYSSWTSNIAQVGSAITMAVWHRVAEGTIIVPVLGSCKFLSNGVPHNTIYGNRLIVGKGTIYLDSIPLHFETSVNFTNNLHSAIAGANTGIYFAYRTVASFINNQAHMGGAIALLGNAFIMIHSETNLTFINNTAEYLGGAIYATSLTGQDSVATGDCFLRYHKLIEPSKWVAQFIFKNNTAMGKNNSIYSSSLEPCLWNRAYGSQDDGHGISSVFCWKDWNYSGNNCSDEIMSAPARFHKNVPVVEMSVLPGVWKYFELDTYDNLNRTVSDYTVFVARSVTDDVVLGENSHYLANNAILLYQTNPSVTSGTVLLQTINTPDPIEAQLDITFMECPPGFNLSLPKGDCMCIAGDFENLIQCRANSTAATSEFQRGYWIGQSPYNNKTVVMAHCPLCSYDHVSQSSSVSVETFEEVQDMLCHSVNRSGILCSKCANGSCPAVNSELFDCVPYDSSYTLPLRILFFILNKLLFPILVLYIIYRYGITVSSGKYNAPVFFAQMVTTVITVDADGIIPYPESLRKLYFMMYDVWNLELRLPKSAGFCLHDDMPVTMVIALNYCVALIPLLVIIALSIVYKCYDKRHGFNSCSCFIQPQNESRCKKAIIWLFFSKNEYLVSTIAAFFVLSYMKIAITTCMLITPAQLYNGQAGYKYVLYWDGSQRYPHDILPYLVIGVVCCVYLIMVPLFLLFLRYAPNIDSDGFLHHLLSGLQADFKSLPSDETNRCFPRRDQEPNRDHEPYERSTDCYKLKCSRAMEFCSIDFNCCTGCFCSHSPRDYRWVSGAYFGLRILMLLPYAASPNAMVHLIFQIVICLAAAGFFAVFQPYGYNHGETTNRHEMANISVGNVTKRKPSQSEWYNKLDASVFIILAAVIALSIYRYYLSMAGTEDSTEALVVQSILLFLPALWFGICAVHFILSKLFFNKQQLTDDIERRDEDPLLSDDDENND